MEFYISPQSGQFYMINVLENQWLSVTYSILASRKFHNSPGTKQMTDSNRLTLVLN